MSEALALLRKVLETGRTTCLFDHGVSEDWFYDEEREAYKFIVAFLKKHRTLPAQETVERKCKLEFPNCPDPIDSYVEALTLRQTHNLMTGLLQEMADRLRKGNTHEALEIARTEVQKITRMTMARELRSLADMVPIVVDDYKRRKEAIGLLGIPSGWPSLDAQTFGWLGGDSVAIVGRIAMGKTSLLLRLAEVAYLHGSRALVVSFEAPLIQLARKILAARLGLSYNRIKFGSLSHWGEERLRNINNILTGPGELHLFMAGFDTDIDQLYMLIRDLRPNIVFLDGGDLLKPTGVRRGARNEEVGMAFQQLRSLALSENIPTISSCHFNREVSVRARTGDLERIGLTDEIGKRCSIVMGIFHPNETDAVASDERITDPGDNTVDVELLKGREGERGRFRVRFDFEHMDFSEVSTVGVGAAEADHDPILGALDDVE